MPEHVIKIEPDFKFTESTVFYADESIMIHRDGPYIRAIDKDGEQIEKIRCPVDFKSFDAIDLGSSVLLVFSGEYVVVLDKSGSKIDAYNLEINKIGKCVTPIKTSQDKKSIVFGTRSRGHVQFINYDYVNRKRISQTSSWKLATINDFEVNNDTMYAMLDNSFIISVNVNTCDSNWSRFETGRVLPKIVPGKDGIFYAGGGLLKQYKEEVKSTKIPLVKVNSVEAKFGNNVILTSMEGMSLDCYDVFSEQVKWKIRSNLAVEKTIPAKILIHGKVNEALIVQTKDHISIVDCDKGKNVYHAQLNDVAIIRRTGSHILLHTYNGSTGIIAGEKL